MPTPKKRLDQHDACSVVIKPRFHHGKPWYVHGLYCKEHDAWIKWLNWQHSQELQALGVPLLNPTKEQQTLMKKHYPSKLATADDWRI